MAQAAISSEVRRRSIPNKSDKLAELLEEAIRRGGFSVGDRFFSTYRIAQEYGVSTGTARKALVELVRKGYLQSSHRSGHFLRQTPPLVRSATTGPKTTTTLMMIVGNAGKWGERLLDQYANTVEQACRRVGWQLLRVNNRAEDIEKARHGAKVAGCLAYVLHEPPTAEMDWSSVITWGGTWRDPACSMLIVNGESASRQAYEHLWDLGHQHVALVRRPPPRERPKGELVAPQSAQESRDRTGRDHTGGLGSVLGMRKAYASMGHPWSKDDVFTVRPDNIEGLYERLLARGITGVCSSDWDATVELYRQAHRRGESIGDRLSIVASGGHDLAELVHPRPARVYWRLVDYGAAVVEALKNLENGKPLPPRIILPVFLEEGPGARAVIQ